MAKSPEHAGSNRTRDHTQPAIASRIVTTTTATTAEEGNPPKRAIIGIEAIRQNSPQSTRLRSSSELPDRNRRLSEAWASRFPALAAQRPKCTKTPTPSSTGNAIKGFEKWELMPCVFSFSGERQGSGTGGTPVACTRLLALGWRFGEGIIVAMVTLEKTS